MPFYAFSARPRDRGGRLRLSQAIALAIVAAILIFAVGVSGVVWWYRNPRPQTTLADLTAAEARWQRSGPASYDLELEKIGNRTDQIEVHVRDGQAVYFTVNGRKPDQRRLWDTWTVPSQFEYIREDLLRAVPPNSSPPLIRADFDSQTGLPWSYSYSGRLGVGFGWKIRKFKVVP